MPVASLLLFFCIFIPYKSCSRTCRLYGAEFCPRLAPAPEDGGGGDEGLAAAAFLVVSPPLPRRADHFPGDGEFGLGDHCSEAMLLINASLSPDRAWRIAGFLAVCTLTAFTLTFNEFLLIGRTSALGLGVAGVVKTVLMFVATTTTFHENFGPIQVVGLSVALGGVCYYYYLRSRAMSA